MILYHGTNKNAAEYIKQHGFNTSERFVGMEQDKNVKDYTFLTSSKSAATWYAKQNIRHKEPYLLTVEYPDSLIFKVDKKGIEKYGAMREVLIKYNQDSGTMIDVDNVKKVLFENGYEAIQYKDKDSMGRDAVIVFKPEKIKLVKISKLRIVENFMTHYFNETLNLPELVMLIGIPGSGKSTWISNANKNNKYIVISPDEIRREITGNISDQIQNGRVWMITKERVVKNLENGRNVILDATMTDASRRKEFIKDLPPAKLKAKVFYIDPEISKQRIKKDIESGKDRASVPDDVIDRMHNDMLKTFKLTGDKQILDVSKLEDEGFEIIN